MRGEVLIDGWPWGWGADMVRTAGERWRCEVCAKSQGAKAGQLIFGKTKVCAACARDACMKRYTRCYSEDAPWHSPWRRALEARGRRRLSTSGA